MGAVIFKTARRSRLGYEPKKSAVARRTERLQAAVMRLGFAPAHGDSRSVFECGRSSCRFGSSGSFPVVVGINRERR